MKVIRRKFLCRLLAAISLSLMAGCEKRRDGGQATFSGAASEYVLVIVLDLSGSFKDFMAEEGKAYDFALQVLDRYFRDRIGTPDKLVIAQISGEKRTLLWEGRPIDLRRDYPDPNAFRKFLLAKSNAGGSLVHEGITHALEYVTTDPAVSSGRAKSAFLVLSDFADNGSAGTDSEQRAVDALTAYGKMGGAVGFYYVDQHRVSRWRAHLRNAGIKQFCVESEIVGRPSLPSLE